MNNNIIGIYGICNSAALCVTNINEDEETVTYYISLIDSDKKPRKSTCKIKTDKKGNLYFNSKIGKIYFDEIMKY